LAALCRLFLAAQRGSGELTFVAETIAYHQRRNEQARRSKRRRFDPPRYWFTLHVPIWEGSLDEIP
jgi:hypothetical protein